MAMGIIFFAIEIFTNTLIDLKILQNPKSLIIKKTSNLLGGEYEDWRYFNMYKDITFETDPLLFWRPKANTGMFNSLGYRGKEPEIIDKNNLYKIIAYGDSNTLGSPETSWPEELNILIKKQFPNIEVYNAGVGGYTSYQGLQRFKEDIKKNKPNLVLINFGWNDPSPAIGKPDSLYGQELTGLQKILRSSKLFLVLQYYYYSNNKVIDDQAKNYIPRVSIEDYKKNINTFISIAKKNNIKIILLTRPINLPSIEDLKIKPITMWRLNVSKYNEALRELAKKNSILLIDWEKYYNLNKNLMDDECHLNSEGFHEAAENIYFTLINKNILK